MRENGDTRTRIQQIALELFTEHGYEATSLREIAERLGVTKAALYYHFKTKEDIIASLMEDRAAAVEELVTWARTQERSQEMRREFLRRYSVMLQQGRHHEVMRFMERNQTALRDHPKSEQMRETMLTVLSILTEPSDPLTVKVKSSMAIFAMHATWFLVREEGHSDDERSAAGLEVALDLIESANTVRQ